MTYYNSDIIIIIIIIINQLFDAYSRLYLSLYSRTSIKKKERRLKMNFFRKGVQHEDFPGGHPS